MTLEQGGLYYVTPDVTLGLRFPGFVRRTTPFISLIIYVDIEHSESIVSEEEKVTTKNRLPTQQ